MTYLIFLFVGLIAGWIASILAKGSGYGILINLILGVIGSFVGGTIFSVFGIQLNGFFGLLISSIVGAVVIIWLVNLLAKK